MYKLTEKEYLEKKKKFKETFMYSEKQKQIVRHIILLAIFMYILINGIMAFTNLIILANNSKILVKNEQILEILLIITSLLLTVGLTGILYSTIKLIAISKEKEILFKDFVEKNNSFFKKL